MYRSLTCIQYITTPLAPVCTRRHQYLRSDFTALAGRPAHALMKALGFKLGFITVRPANNGSGGGALSSSSSSSSSQAGGAAAQWKRPKGGPEEASAEIMVAVRASGAWKALTRIVSVFVSFLFSGLVGAHSLPILFYKGRLLWCPSA